MQVHTSADVPEALVAMTAGRPIEHRAVSAAFLREFTAVHITPQLCKRATDEAIQYLNGQIEEVAAALLGSGLGSGPDTYSSEQTELTTTTSTAQRGFSKQKLSAKLKLLKLDLRRRKSRPYMSTRDVHKYIIKPQTDEQMCRYVELQWVQSLSLTGLPPVGPASSFVSHSWDSPWDSLMDALCEHSDRSDPPPRYWVDLFAVNQHWPGTTHCSGSTGCPGCAAMKQDLPDWATMATMQNTSGTQEGGFGRVLGFAKHVLVFMEPWSTPRPPTRVWCLFEMYNCLAEVGGRADVVLSREEQQAMQVSLITNFSAFEKLIVGIDARDAEVTVAADLDQIFALIRSSHSGFGGLNEAIKQSMFHWLAESGQDLLQKMDSSAAKLSTSAIENEVRRHHYPAVRACMLSLINRWPELAAAMPMVAYSLLAVFCCVVYVLEKLDTTGSLFGETIYVVGLLLWGGIISFGAQLKLMRLKHQLRVVPPCPCSPRWITWFVGIGTGYGLWLMLAAVCLWLDDCKARSEPIFLVQAIAAIYGAVSIAMYDTTATAVQLAMLSVRVGWLLEKLKRPEQAHEQLATAHQKLLRLLGDDAVGAYVAAPGLIAALRDLDRHADADQLASKTLAAVDRNLGSLGYRLVFAVFNEEGRLNWLQCLKALPIITLDKIVADSGRSSVTSRWRWLRAEVLAAQGKPAEDVLTALRAAVDAGCAFSARATPAFAALFALHDSAGRASADSNDHDSNGLPDGIELIAESDGLSQLELIEAHARRNRKRGDVMFVFRVVGAAAVITSVTYLVIWLNWLQG